MVARVNGETIGVDEFRTRWNEYRVGPEAGLGPIPEELAVRKKVLNELIEEKVLIAETRRRDLKVPDERVNQALRDIERDYPPGSFDGALKEQRITRSRFKQRIRTQLTIDTLIREVTRATRAPGPETIRKYYQDHVDDFRREEQIRIAQIVVKTEPDALALVQGLKEGARFGDLARAHSFTPEGAHGGDLGYVKTSALPPVIVEAVQKLAPGKRAGPIQTGYGWHVVKLLDRRPARVEPEEEAAAEIVALLTQREREQNFLNWRRELLSRAKIERNHALLASIH